jgi:hypothetical protein
MAQSSNLTITVGADSSKLRADLAQAQAELRNFQKELRTAAEAARQTGDATQVQAAAGRYEAASARVRTFANEIRAASRAQADTTPWLAAIGRGLSELHGRLGQVGSGFREMSDRTLPGWRTAVAGLGVGALAQQFLSLADSAAKSTHALQESAEAIGISAEKFQAVQLAGVRAAVDPDETTKILERVSKAFGEARLESAKARGQVASDVTLLTGSLAQQSEAAYVLRGNLAAAGEAAKGAAGSAGQLLTQFDQGGAILRGGIKAVVDTSSALKFLKINVDQYGSSEEELFRATSDIVKALEGMKNASERNAVSAMLVGKAWGPAVAVFRDMPARVKSAEEAIQRYGIALGAEEAKQGKAYTTAYNTLTHVLERSRAIVGNMLGTALVPLFEGLTQLIADNLAHIREWAQTVATTLKPVFTDVVKLFSQGLSAKFDTQAVTQAAQVLRVLAAAAGAAAVAFGLLTSAADGVAVALNAVFGTEFTGGGLLALALILRLAGAFRLVGAAISVLVAVLPAIGAGFAAIAGAIGWPALLVLGLVALVAALLTFSETFRGNVVAALQGAWDLAKAFGSWLADTFSAGVGSVAKAFADAWQWATDYVKGLWTGLMGWLDGLIQKAKDALSAIGSILGAGGAAAASGANAMPAMAAGGQVRGPGTGTSDSILARLSAGEFVMRSAAVQRWGVGLMHSLNSFAQGGLVGVPALRFAAGGLAVAGGQTAAVFNFEAGHSFRLHGPADVVHAMATAASHQQMRSAGAKPTWYGGKPGR